MHDLIVYGIYGIVLLFGAIVLHFRGAPPSKDGQVIHKAAQRTCGK